jgi:hypothetical protein
MIQFKCRKCRQLLFSDKELVTNHGNIYSKECLDLCSNESKVWYLSEQSLSDWVLKQLNAFDWIKGKIICPNTECNSRIGSFNFINGVKCCCDSYELPNIHIVKSKVDQQLIH